MDMNKINEQLLIERYLQGTLSNEEEKVFEEALIASPELLEQVEVAERLREGMKDLHALEGQEAADSRRYLGAEPARSPLLAAVGGLFRSPAYALAATVLLAVSLVMTGSLYVQNSEPFTQTHVSELFETRSDEDEPNLIERGKPGEQHVLMIDVGYEPYSHSRYRARLSRLGDGQAAETVLLRDNMQPGYLGIALDMPSELLEPGDYEIWIGGWNDEWPDDHEYESVTEVAFRVQ